MVGICGSPQASAARQRRGNDGTGATYFGKIACEAIIPKYRTDGEERDDTNQ